MMEDKERIKALEKRIDALEHFLSEFIGWGRHTDDFSYDLLGHMDEDAREYIEKLIKKS